MASGGPPRHGGQRPQPPPLNVLRQPRGPGPDSTSFQTNPMRQNSPAPHRNVPPPPRYSQAPQPMNVHQPSTQPPRTQAQSGFHGDMVLDTSYLEGCASLLDQIDKKVVVVLRDRRNIIGMLRSCDQFNNLVLHQAVERIHVEKEFGDIPRGVFLIRGDNVVLVGEVDAEKERLSPLIRVPVERILDLQRQQEEVTRGKDIKRSELAKLRGMAYSFDADPDAD